MSETHGGKRKKAGRPPGRATKKTREIADACAESGITPLEYMLNVMRDETADEKRRDDMAKSAAPYMHPRLQTTEQKGKIELDGQETVRAFRETLFDIINTSQATS